MEIACSTIAERAARLIPMREKLIEEISKMDRVHLNGDREKRLPGSVNFSFEGVEGESLLLMLDMKGTQPPPARPAPPAHWIPATCCWPSG